jgi:uncharacterized protein
MSEKTLKKVIHSVLMTEAPQVSFAWQGGEPTLMGLEFFKQAVEFQEHLREDIRVSNGLQTNGILIDRNWARFLAKREFLVGLSLDGPRHIHNRYRFLRGGKGSWSRVTDRAKLLLDSGVAVNALAVVNDFSVRYPQEIYEFFKSLGLNHMQFIPCVEPDINNSDQVSPFSVQAEQYGEFLISLFDLWIGDFIDNKPTTFIRYFDSIFFNYVDLPAPDCTLHKECGIYLVIEYNGDVYSCDFYVDNEWKLGNVYQDKLVDLLNSPVQERFGNIKANISDVCLGCKWLNYCFGGCPKDRLVSKDKRRSYLCLAYKMFFKYADPVLKNLAVRWKANTGL